MQFHTNIMERNRVSKLMKVVGSVYKVLGWKHFSKNGAALAFCRMQGEIGSAAVHLQHY